VPPRSRRAPCSRSIDPFKQPRSQPWRRWLDEHPTSQGRASLLLALGRLDEADVAIERIVPKAPEDYFDVALLRATRVLFGAGSVDTAPIHEGWRSLPPSRERRHRRECTAVLDAMVAVADGRDPLPILTAARLELDAVHRTMRIGWVAAKWVVIGMGGIAIGLVLGLVLTA
jgi:hypothetical protein